MSVIDNNKVRFSRTPNGEAVVIDEKTALIPEFLDRLIAGHNAAAEIAEYMNRPGDWNGGDVCEVANEELQCAGFKILDLDEKPTELPIEAETDGLYMASDTVCDEYDTALHCMAREVSAWLVEKGFEELSFEQRQCLLDPERVEEAEDMMDDLQARVGVPAELVDPILEVLPIRPIRAKAAPVLLTVRPREGAPVCNVQFARYQVDGTIAIQLIDSRDGETWTTATVCMVPGHHTGARQVWLKGWSENEGLPEALEAAGIVTIIATARCGYAMAQLAELSDKAMTELERQQKADPARFGVKS